MKLKKRIISLLLAVAIFSCLIPQVNITAHAATSGYEIVSYARQYIGYPYKNGTSGPKSFDCSGFVYYVFKHFGIELTTGASNYYNNPTKYGTVVGKGSIANAQMGDIISWSGHVAIYTEDGYCVEALGTKYGVLESVKVDRHTNGKNYKVIRVKGITSIEAPKISSPSKTNNGVEIKWGKVANAEKYRVYRKAGSGDWVALGNTTTTSFTDKTAANNTTYSYTVRCISADGKNFTSDYDRIGKSIKPVGTPKLLAATATATGVNIKWSSVAGAAKYRVYYYTGSGDWTKLADTTSASYTWTGAKSGTKYKFTVRCLSGDGNTFTSGFDTAGLSLNYIAAPKLSSVYAVQTGVQINWEKATGAELYRVYYKNSSGGWTKIADTKSTSYTWTGVKAGTDYTFTVRCLTGDAKEFTSSFDPAGISLKYVSAPAISSLENVNSGVKISWGKVPGAALYRVYYKNSSGGWTKIADTASNSYTWTSVKGGTNYTFTIRCLTGDAKYFASGFDAAGKSIKYIAAPKLSSVENTATGVKITWGKVSGAELYRVYYKNSTGGWTKIADTDSTSYTWKSAKSGTNYTFTVRCLTGDAKYFASDFDGTGKSIKYIAAPKLSSAYAVQTGIQINWEKVTGAALYRVYYKTANGWTKIADTTGTSYIWKGAKVGTNYTFTVRCLTSDSKSFTSSFDSVGKSLKYVAAPKLSSVENTATGVKITWEKVSGAELYRVYYKNSTGGWTKIADTDSTSYTWKSAKSGTNYTFTVRCLTGDAKYFASGFDSVGKSIKYIAAPKLLSVSDTSKGIQITWGKVSGAALYRVYYKNNSGGWTKISDTSSTSYTWKGAKSDTDYTFTVRCLTSDAKYFASGFDATGISIIRQKNENQETEEPKIENQENEEQEGIAFLFGFLI